MSDESSKPSEIVIDFGDDDQKAHWLKIIDYHTEEIVALMKRVKEHQAHRAEAEEEFYADVPQDWDVIRVGGRAVYERELKEGTSRVYMDDLKQRYPKLYQELLRSKPSEKVRRL